MSYEYRNDALRIMFKLSYPPFQSLTRMRGKLYFRILSNIALLCVTALGTPPARCFVPTVPEG